MKNKKIKCLQEDASLEQVISKLNEIIEKLNYLADENIHISKKDFEDRVCHTKRIGTSNIFTRM